MTDVMKAIVKLPPKTRQSIALKSNYEDFSPPQRHQKEPPRFDSYLVSDRLYMQVPSAIVEYDVLDLLQTCHPQDIHLSSQPFPELSSGYITFPSKDQADLAFTLFNGANFSNGMRLLLYMNPLTNECDPEPAADILQVQNLPSDSTNKSLYDLFRPFGPMALCKVVVEQGTVDYHGAALIQYYHTDDADHAVSFMNNRRIQESIINVFPFVSGKRQRSNTGMDGQYGSHSSNHTKQGSDANPIDYTNLYIKNLDLNAKSSDLFKHFRKFGHIISARVMKNARTNQSKGFGFVSFINTEEANRALHGMNGQYILSKAVQVAFHEPKKTRNDKCPDGGGDTTQQHDTNGSGGTHYGGPAPSNTADTNKPNHNTHNTHSSHMATAYSPSTPQTNYSLQSPVPQQHHYHNRQHQQQPQYYSSPSPSSSSYQQPQSYQQQHTLNDDLTSYRSPLGGKRSHQQPLVGKSSQTSLSNGPMLDHNTNINGHYSPRTNSHSGNAYPPASNNKKGTMHSVEYNHSYSNYSSSRRQQLGTGTYNSTITNTPPSLSTLASGASIQPPPPTHHHLNARENGKRPSMRRRGSIESICSVMTETSTNAQRQRLTNAVLQCNGDGEEAGVIADQVADIVDMLLTLKKKERSLCLFNPDFLKSKVQQAKTALETFDGDEEDDLGNSTNDNKNNSDDEHGLHTAPVLPEINRAVSTPPAKESNMKTNDAASGDDPSIRRSQTASSPPVAENMDAFLASLEGLAMHEKKQKLGDWLFPLVKATGIKHAPKITIRLLDTVPLHELAHLMHVESSLRLKIDQVMVGES